MSEIKRPLGGKILTKPFLLLAVRRLRRYG